MSDHRCFRVSEVDLEELRNETQDQRWLDSLSNWIRRFAPRVDEVVLQIANAFADTKLGDGIGLFEAKGLDDYEYIEELKQLRETDEKLDWKRISYDDLERCYASPTFFDAQGFVFHLPAFLTAELNDKHPYGFMERIYRYEEHPAGWSKLLSEKQKDAVISVLELIREHPCYEHEADDIDAAIRKLTVER